MVNVLSDSSAESLDWNVRDDLKGLSLEEINKKQPKLPYAVGAINVDGSLNIGTMIRTAVIYGASDFFIIGKKKYDKRSTVGAQNYIKIHKIDEVEREIDLFNTLMRFKYFPVYIETSGEELTNDRLNKLAHSAKEYDIKSCFIFGSESQGIPFKISHLEDVYKLPQYGVLRSLNVSSCASIVMYKFVEALNN